MNMNYVTTFARFNLKEEIYTTIAIDIWYK